jgi:hypothetical protein
MSGQSDGHTPDMADRQGVRLISPDATNRQRSMWFGIALGWAVTWTCAYFLSALNDVGWLVAVWYVAQAPFTVFFYPLLWATSSGVVVVAAISTLQGLFVGAVISYLLARRRA